MVTGDHKLTGLAIARELGIAREGDRAVDGPELERMGEAELRDAAARRRVRARAAGAEAAHRARRCRRAARWWR
jgi:Ca2+-transporting ATPase